MAYEHIKCPKCEASFGQEIKFISHLTTAHEIDDPERFYAEIFLDGKTPTCACSHECEIPIPWSCWKKGYTSKYARGHNARVESTYSSPERQAEFAVKRRAGYAAGKYVVWNKGLSKESDERVKAQAAAIAKSLNEGYSSGSIVDWRVDNEEKALSVAKKCSETKKQMYADGIIESWNKGKTKLTDERLKLISDKIAQKYINNPEMGNRIKQKNLKNRLEKYPNFALASDINDYKKRRVDRLTFKCNTCGNLQEKSLAMLEDTPICFSCHPKESKGQLEILEFVRSLGVEAASNDRSIISPLEVDVYVPSHKLGIEYHGLYWHSTKVCTSKTKDDEKIKSSLIAGIKLLIIYEDEWRDHRIIIEGMIRHRLGLSTNVYNARSLTLRQLTTLESKTFFEANHLEGAVPCKVSFGLVNTASGEVIAGMSLRRPFHSSKSNRLEVGRSACLTDSSVRGWIGKLTKASHEYALANGFEGLMTYVDNRVGSGLGYSSNMWKLDRASTGPRFWWTDFTNRFNRFKYRADKSAGLTQRQVADAAGVVEIWGCANSTYMT